MIVYLAVNRVNGKFYVAGTLGKMKQRIGDCQRQTTHQPIAEPEAARYVGLNCYR